MRTGNNCSNNNIDKKADREKHTLVLVHDYYGSFYFFFKTTDFPTDAAVGVFSLKGGRIRRLT